jgi:hypothetical protein
MNTNTQKLVFSKIQNQKLGLKKEKFGAIDDAIEQEQNSFIQDAGQLKQYMDNMSQYSMEIEDALRNVSIIASSFTESYSRLSEYYNLFDELNNRNAEFENLGIANRSADWTMLSDMFEDEIGRYNDVQNAIKNII